MTFTTAMTAPSRRTLREHYLVQGLLAVYLLVWIGLAIAPLDRHDWLLENLLAIATIVVLIATYRRFPFSDLSYVLIAAFMLLHAVGAHYTYAKVPLGFWMKEALDLSRNHFDRIVHFGFGFFLAYPAYEVLLRTAKVTKGWAALIAALAVISLSGSFEVIESWVALFVSPELGAAYLGTQGDEWDAQKDMTMAIIGAVLTILITLRFEKIAAGRIPQMTSKQDHGYATE